MKIKIKGRKCIGFFSLAFGLMFRSRQNLIMEFPTVRRISLHMWFVFFPIDVLVLDSDRRIVEIKKNFMPFTFWTASKRGKYIVELGFKEDVKIDDEITWD